MPSKTEAIVSEVGVHGAIDLLLARRAGNDRRLDQASSGQLATQFARAYNAWCRG